MVIIGGFLGFNLIAQLTHDFGYPLAANVISYAWIILVIYTWVGLPYFQKVLKKELEDFRFNPNF
jgi:uncharacterized membrane protein (DUF485 family)